MFSRRELNKARKELQVQFKATGTVTSKLTEVQRAYLLEDFGKWKHKRFDLITRDGSFTDLEHKLSEVLHDIHEYAVKEKLTDVWYTPSWSGSINIHGCLAKSDAELVAAFLKHCQKIEREKLAAKKRKKARRDAEKQAKALNQAATVKEVAKLLKQLKALSAAKTAKQAAKTTKPRKKAKKTSTKTKKVVKSILPLEGDGLIGY